MLFLVLITTIGAWIGYANPIYQLPIAALFFPAGLVRIGFKANSGYSAFKYGWLGGTLAAIGCFYWMVIPVQYYGGLPWAVALPCPVLLAGYIGLYYAFFALFIFYAKDNLSTINLCLTGGLVWASLEILMGSLFSGFPWMNLASAFSPWPATIQLASIIGAYALSGVIVTLTASLAIAPKDLKAILIAALSTIFIVGFGFYRIQFATENISSGITVTVAQGNIDQGHKWNPEFQATTLKEYFQLTIAAINQDKPAIVIWPETAMPFYIQDDSSLTRALKAFAQNEHIDIITGSPAYRITNHKTREYVLLNRAWLIDDTGRSLQHYDKEHLVPFGEYMPLKEIIPFKKLVKAAGDFVAGQNKKPLFFDGIALGMLICYEAIFPDLAQNQVRNGANILLNISNDAWFGDTSAPRQHLNLTILRAVEQGRWLVRSTNTGISAFVSPQGQISSMSKQFIPQFMTATLAPLSQNTIFHSIYPCVNLTIYALTALSILLIILGNIKRKY